MLMRRREFVLAVAGLIAAHRAAGSTTPEPAKVEKLTLSDAEWRKRLPREQFHILREEGT